MRQNGGPARALTGSKRHERCPSSDGVFLFLFVQDRENKGTEESLGDLVSSQPCLCFLPSRIPSPLPTRERPLIRTSTEHPNRSESRSKSEAAGQSRCRMTKPLRERRNHSMPFSLSIAPSSLPSLSPSAASRRPHFAPNTHLSSGPDAAWATTARRAATGAAAGRRAATFGLGIEESAGAAVLLIETAGRAAATARGAALPARRESTAGRAVTKAREVASIAFEASCGGKG